MKDNALHIVHLNYDWRDLCGSHPDMVQQKYYRDKLHPDTNIFFVISWAKKAYERQITPNIYTVHMRARFSWLKPLYDFLMFFRASAHVKNHGFVPDIIMVYDVALLPAAYRIKQRCGGKVVLCLTNLTIAYTRIRRFGMIKSAYYWFWLRLAGMYTDAVYTINETVKEYICMHTTISQDKIRIFVSDTIGSEYKKTVSLLDKKNIAEELRTKHHVTEKHLLLSVGRIEPEKGFERLFQALAHTNADYKLLIIGGGTNNGYRNRLERMIDRLAIGHKVVFLGEVPHNDLWRYYVAADLFVLLSRAEALGLVFWEAMMMNTPVLGSRADGIVESVGIHEERGYLWDEADGYPAFQEKILRILGRDAVTLEKMARAREYVRAKLVDTYSINHLYNEIVS